MHPSSIPFTLLGGYLGAGKTTLVNRLLAASTDRRLAVLVNDVGAVNVDATLIARHDGETIELTNGCVCCAIADDLGPALEQVRRLTAARPVDHVVMELSGVAEPARVVPWANTPGFGLDGIVVCADADQIVELSRRRFVGDTVRTQLAAADVVLLTKTDLAVDGGVAARSAVAGLTDAPIVDAGSAEVAELLLVGGSAVDGPVDSPSHDRHRTAVVDVSGRSLARLEALVEQLGDDVVRAKGVVRCSDVDEPIEVHVVGTRRVVRRRPDLEHTDDRLVVVSVPDGS